MDCRDKDIGEITAGWAHFVWERRIRRFFARFDKLNGLVPELAEGFSIDEHGV